MIEKSALKFSVISLTSVLRLLTSEIYPDKKTQQPAITKIALQGAHCIS